MHWRRVRGPGSRTASVVNAVGAVATLLALIVILIAKFVEGAWITLVLIPGLLVLFGRVKQHYETVAEQVRYPHPIDVRSGEPPLVVVPIASWNILSERALRFGLELSSEVMAVYVSQSEGDDEALRRDWSQYVETPLRGVGRAQPRLQILPSPYRRLVRPVVDYVSGLKVEHPSRVIAVVVSELVETHWYQYLLHNHRAE